MPFIPDCQFSVKCPTVRCYFAKMKFFVLATLASVVASSVLYEKPTTYSPSRHRPARVKSSSPYNFKYEVKVDNYTSYGDTRVRDEQGRISGSYHVRLPDGRHQHVSYRVEGNGYVADVQYNRDTKYSASNVVEYKEKFDHGYKEQSQKKSSIRNSSRETAKRKCSDSKATCHEESSYQKPKEQIYAAPANDRPVALFYQQASSRTSSPILAEPIYYTPSTHTAPLRTNGNADKSHQVSTTTEFSPGNVVFTYAPEEYGFWQVMYTIPNYLKPVSGVRVITTTTEKPVYLTTTARIVPIYNRPTSAHQFPSTTPKIPYYTPTPTTPRTPYPATTLAYKKVISNKKPVHRPVTKIHASANIAKKPGKVLASSSHKTHLLATTKRPPTTTAVYRTPSPITRPYRIPVSTTLAYRKPVPANLAHKKPLKTTQHNPQIQQQHVNKIPVSTTPANYPKPPTTTPGHNIRYHTTKRHKVDPSQAVSKKPYVIYKPQSNRVPIKAKDPYVIASSHKTNSYVVPSTVNHVPAYTVVLFKPPKKIIRTKPVKSTRIL